VASFFCWDSAPAASADPLQFFADPQGLRDLPQDGLLELRCRGAAPEKAEVGGEAGEGEEARGKGLGARGNIVLPLASSLVPLARWVME